VPDVNDSLIVLLVVGARLLVPLAIPRYPVPAGLAALVIDGVDHGILQAHTAVNLDRYQNYDKALDIYYLSIEYLAILRNWTNLSALRMGRILFYYRLVGSLLFELLHIRALLLFFPNTFEYFFLWYEALRLRWNPRRLTPTFVIGSAFAIWVLIKVPQEYWIHVAQLDATDAIKQHVFGAPIDAPWGAVVVDNLPLVVLLVAAVIALLVLACFAIVTILPPPDWPFSFDADAHGRDVSAEEALATRQTMAARVFGARLFEKIAFVGLVTVIFSQVLPSATVTPLEAAVGVTLVIGLNTAVSAWLIRRGVVLRSAVAEFAGMAVTNGLIAAAFALALSFRGRSFDAPTLLFALLLVTLLVTLYDRFRPLARARETRAAHALHAAGASIGG